MIKNIIFDLDGTISKSGEGIIKAFEYSLDKMDIIYKVDDLKKYIGPPLRESFVKEVGEAKADEAVDYYRYYYFEKGMYETSMYEGIEQLIKYLYNNSYRLFVATSKGRESSLKILDYFGIGNYFTYVEGSTESLNTKVRVLESLLRKNNLKRDESIMIGDRLYDINASFKLGLKSIGVEYGYGNIGEFKRASYIVKEPLEIKDILEKIN
ncbi:HAD-IA family hydrolase [Anaerococcus sp. AGMB00486]|uniref:HAD-IA family hydrolase n=1 Tax=Anaerococcus faecalis TaxID=2742993 RepID=A0ABX2N8I1_9FIRM|nr:MULTISPECIES: HAD-IA family hydrolase [Anaerococcus]MDY3006243.1 HAD-IA family hydrolase [Anaerococcus porci]NVF10980.1 HAD-IA family hydrolase [Anaerococcus faecalis]